MTRLSSCHVIAKTHHVDSVFPEKVKKRLEKDFCHTDFYLCQSTDVGDVIWCTGLCAAPDPGHLFLRSITGQYVKSYANI